MNIEQHSKSKLYVLCDARQECIRMIAEVVRKKQWQPKETNYSRARHSNISSHLQKLANTVCAGDDIIVAVPAIDKSQMKCVVKALTELLQNGINIYWYYAPKWFDTEESVTKVFSNDAVKSAADNGTAIEILNEYYKNEFKEDASEAENRLQAYINYRLMYLFMGADTEASTFKAIIGALQKNAETKFTYPTDEASDMAELVKNYSVYKPSMAGRSEIFEKHKKRVVDLARLNKDVMIVGETGTGKEATAYYLHEFSPRRGKKFVAVNCACFTEELLTSELFGHLKGSFSDAKTAKKGLVEEIDGGTLFLDEIPDASPRVQAMLLRFLQSGQYSPVGSNEIRRVDVKIIAGAQPALLFKLRDDLKYRLEERIHTLSLRELNDIYSNGSRDGTFKGLPDIISMARNLAVSCIGKNKLGSGEGGFNFKTSQICHADIVNFWQEIERPEIVELFTGYAWPGNVRELQTCISRHLCEGIPLNEIVAQLRKESHFSIVQAGPLNPSQTAVTGQRIAENSSSPGTVVFGPLNSLEDLIPFYELENLYSEHVRNSIENGSLKGIPGTKLQEKLGLSPNTFRDYIVNGVKKQRQKKSP
jgi:DNA-binding NtrC family response regulator